MNPPPYRPTASVAAVLDAALTLAKVPEPLRRVAGGAQ
jgi:hypothetical protein